MQSCQSCLRTPACDPRHCIPPAPPATTGAAPAPHRTRLTAPVLAHWRCRPPHLPCLAEAPFPHLPMQKSRKTTSSISSTSTCPPAKPLTRAARHPNPPNPTPEPSPAPRRDFVRRWQCARGCGALSRTRLGDGARQGGVCEWLQGRIGRAPRHRWLRVNRGRCPGLLPGGLSACPTPRSACTTPHDARSHAGHGARGRGSPRRPS
jgi:hypothetical protein